MLMRIVPSFNMTITEENDIRWSSPMILNMGCYEFSILIHFHNEKSRHIYKDDNPDIEYILSQMVTVIAAL